MIEPRVGQIWRRVGTGWLSKEEVGTAIKLTGEVRGLWQFEGSGGGFSSMRFRGTSGFRPEFCNGSELQLEELSLVNLILSRYD